MGGAQIRRLASASGRFMTSRARNGRTTARSAIGHRTLTEAAPTRADELSRAERAELLQAFEAQRALRPQAGPERDAERLALLEKLGTRQPLAHG